MHGEVKVTLLVVATDARNISYICENNLTEVHMLKNHNLLFNDTFYYNYYDCFTFTDFY